MAIIPKGGGGKPEEEKTVTAGTSATEVLPSSGKTIKKLTVNPTPTEEKTVTPTTSQQTVSPSNGKHLAKVIVKAIQTEDKTITAGTEQISVTPSSGKYIKNVTVNPTPSQSKNVIPNESAQTVNPDSGKLLSSVSIGAIQTEEKTVTAGTSSATVTPTSGKYIKSVTVNPTPSQSKTVTPSTSQQTVSPDSGKLLSQVIVKAMEDVTPEVTAQTPIITQIAENLGVTIRTPSGTNKQILQRNNANLQLISGYKPPFKIVTWAGGTDEEIVKMVQLADQGIINLSDYWAVGDTRTVQLSAMSATGVGESHSAQKVDLVLMHAGGYTLNAAVASGRTTCSFIVGQKDSLATAGDMNSSNTNSGSWNGSARRTWCNSVYKNALPSTLLPIFKQFKTITAQTYNGTALMTSLDYFALPAEREVFGAGYGYAGSGYANNTEAACKDIFQFEYYRTKSNRIKKLGISGSASSWWGRSPSHNSSIYFCYVDSSGSSGIDLASSTIGLSPFGCI